MELIIFVVLIVLVVLYVMIKSAIDEKNDRKAYREKLRNQYGSFPDREYRTEEYESITRLFAQQKGENDIDDITWNDLDMDGIFGMINHTQSSSGAEYLYAMLRKPNLSGEKLRTMEKHIQYLMKQEEERLDLQMALHDLGRSGRFSLFDYIEYLDNLGDRSNKKHFIAIIMLIASIALIFVSSTLGVIMLIVVACINIVQYLGDKNKILPYITSFAYIMRMMQCADKILKLELADMQDYANTLKEKRSKFKTFQRNSDMVFQMNSVSSSPSEMLFDYVKMLTHFDIIKFNQMLHIVQNRKEEIIAIVEDIGYLDAVIAIGAFRASLPYYCVPELEEGREVTLKITEGYHPFISNPVSNSFTQKKGMLVTGSNASGKSTFLKMAAINAVLAQTIHTCTAREYAGAFYRIYSSMALRDSLDDGESYYIVEIKALKRIMDAADKDTANPLLCFVDEVLRGTNTVERIAASAQILEKLSQKHVYCFAATHDIELTHLLEHIYDNYHFEEEVRDGDVLFSYRLLNGRAQSRNAIRLLQIIGFSEDIIQKADHMAGRFLSTGEWS